MTSQNEKLKKRRIGIDARFFGPKQKGLGRYTQKLVQYLEKIDGGSSEFEYFIFLRKEAFEEYQPGFSNFKKVLADFPWYSFSEQFKFPFFLRKFRLDLVHFCHFNVPIFYFGKFVVTIHDLILFHYPTPRNTTLNKYFYFLKLFAYHQVIRNAAKKAEKIIAVSEFTKKDIQEELKVNPPAGGEKLKVIYEGVEFSGIGEGFLAESDVLKKYDIIKPYYLYVGNAYPHKNLEKLVLAHKKVVEVFPDWKLVLVGGKDFFYRRLKKLVKKEKIKGVLFTGFVDDEDLDVVYKGASFYVFPSLYEGFGLPPLEALVRGLPVLSSNLTSMPEILGDAVSYFNPKDENDIQNSILEMIEKIKKDKFELKIEINWQEKYSWKKMAKETANVYQSCLLK